MLQKLQKRKSSTGFTIIEVMIVLAIAGLILLIVFLAVPALQRSSRNTQRKNDVSALLAAVSEYADNNSGSLPATCSGTTTITVGAGTTSQSRMGYYNGGCSVTTTPAAGAVGFTTGAHVAASNDSLVITTGANCNGTAAVAGTARGVVALYQIETGSGTTAAVCQES